MAWQQQQQQQQQLCTNTSEIITGGFSPSSPAGPPPAAGRSALGRSDWPAARGLGVGRGVSDRVGALEEQPQRGLRGHGEARSTLCRTPGPPGPPLRPPCACHPAGRRAEEEHLGEQPADDRGQQRRVLHGQEALHHGHEPIRRPGETPRPPSNKVP